MKTPINQPPAEKLKANYSWNERIRNCTAILLALGFGSLVLWNLGTVYTGSLAPALLVAAFLGILLSDLVTGLVHWGADTWGRVDTPFFGKLLIRAFREHHVSPRGIADHPWYETNGETALGAAPIFAAMLLWLPEPGEVFHILAWSLLFSFTTASLLANQFHKWAHMDRVPRWVRLLQAPGIFLSRERHQRHHTLPYTIGYCITTGWMNPLLDRIRFWRFLERSVIRITGWLPREDDVGRDAAIRICGETGLPVPSPIDKTESVRS